MLCALVVGHWGNQKENGEIIYEESTDITRMS
jgi:hypothetical protein